MSNLLKNKPAPPGLLNNKDQPTGSTICVDHSSLVDQHLVEHVSAGVTPGCVARNLAQNINIMDTAGLDMSRS